MTTKKHYVVIHDNKIVEFDKIEQFYRFYSDNYGSIVEIHLNWLLCEEEVDHYDRTFLKGFVDKFGFTWNGVANMFDNLPESSMYGSNKGEFIRQKRKTSAAQLKKEYVKTFDSNVLPVRDVYIQTLTNDLSAVAQEYQAPVEVVKTLSDEIVSDVNAVLDVIDTIRSRYPSEVRALSEQRDIIKASYTEFITRKTQLASTHNSLRLMFISDIHIPQHRRDALHLASQIMEYANPHWVTGLNDFFDFDEFSRWENTDPRLQLWTSEGLHKPRMIAQTIHNHWRKIAPNLNLYGRGILGLTGNHDKRIASFLLENNPALVSELYTNFMRDMYESGMLMFSNHVNTEPIITLSPGLKVVHGISSSSNTTTASKKTIEGVSSQQYSEIGGGVFYNVVSGHLHRSFTNTHNGVTHWNAGCHCTLAPSYLKSVPKWDLGCVIVDYEPNGRFVYGENIVYTRRKDALTARYNGVEFSTPLDDTTQHYEEIPSY